jgi:hypothetical protein
LPTSGLSSRSLVEPLGLAELALGHRPGLVLAEDALALPPVH